MKTNTRALLSLVAFFLLLATAAPLLAQEQGARPAAERVYRFEPRQEVALADFAAEGLILDIGGGGEAVIGQLKPKQVIAIDLIKKELEDAPAGPLLKIVMDARDLKVLDNSFQMATAFFTFMFVPPTDHEQVMREAYRVLKPGGRLLIWDVVIPAERVEPSKDVAVFPLTVKLPGKTITTGYGMLWPDRNLNAAYYSALAAKVGFKCGTPEALNHHAFYLELTKPAEADSRAVAWELCPNLPE